MSKADDQFLKEFAGVIALLGIFAVAMYFLANSIHNDELARTSRQAEAVAKRITPFASARVGDPSKVAVVEKKQSVAAPAPAASAELAEVPPAADGKDGAATYNAVCLACHMTGAANAPKLDDKAAWETRASAGGLLGMVKVAIKGKGAMPANGGNPSLTPADIANAVRYMLDKAGVQAN